jgi:uncharacterized protein YecT (DUF1311 family)
MRKLIFTVIFLLNASNCFALVDEEVVKAMTKLTSLTAEEIEQDYNRCDGNTYQMKICASYQWVAEDLRMNKIYKEIRAKAKLMGYEQSLLQSQRTWIAYRDSTCALEGQMGAGGGTAEGLYILSCKRRITEERADGLAELLKNE